MIDPLVIIINQSLLTGIVPLRLKIAKVIPLFKKDDNTIVDNYRPISLLPWISKIFDRIAYKQLYSYFSDFKLFYFSQHGFRTLHSTETATLEFIDRVLNCLDSGNTDLSIFIDLSKAFDTIDHHILLSKLSYYGIRNNSLSWFESYLTCQRCLYSRGAGETRVVERYSGRGKALYSSPLVWWTPGWESPGRGDPVCRERGALLPPACEMITGESETPVNRVSWLPRLW